MAPRNNRDNNPWFSTSGISFPDVGGWFGGLGGEMQGPALESGEWLRRRN